MKRIKRQNIPTKGRALPLMKQMRMSIQKLYMNVQSSFICSKKKKKNRGNPTVHKEVSMMNVSWYSHRVNYRSAVKKERTVNTHTWMCLTSFRHAKEARANKNKCVCLCVCIVPFI